MRFLLVSLAVSAFAAPGLRAANRPATGAIQGMRTMGAPKSKLARKLSVKADAASSKGAAPAKAESKPKEGLEALYGGLYDGQVFETYGWDPWGFSKKSSKETLMMFREAELTHARVAMLAAAGILTAERWHPFFNSPDGTALEQAGYILEKYPAFWFSAGLVMSAVELLRAAKVFKNGGTKGKYIFRPYSADALTLKDGVEPGDLGWDPLGIKPEYYEGEGGFLERQNQEINNGRLAMLATMGILVQEALTGKAQG